MRERLIAVRVVLAVVALPWILFFGAHYGMDALAWLQRLAGRRWPYAMEFLWRMDWEIMRLMQDMMGYALWTALLGDNAGEVLTGVLVLLQLPGAVALLIWQWVLGRRWRRLRGLLQ